MVKNGYRMVKSGCEWDFSAYSGSKFLSSSVCFKVIKICKIKCLGKLKFRQKWPSLYMVLTNHNSHVRIRSLWNRVYLPKLDIFETGWWWRKFCATMRWKISIATRFNHPTTIFDHPKIWSFWSKNRLSKRLYFLKIYSFE